MSKRKISEDDDVTVEIGSRKEPRRSFIVKNKNIDDAMSDIIDLTSSTDDEQSDNGPYLPVPENQQNHENEWTVAVGSSKEHRRRTKTKDKSVENAKFDIIDLTSSTDDEQNDTEPGLFPENKLPPKNQLVLDSGNRVVSLFLGGRGVYCGKCAECLRQSCGHCNNCLSDNYMNTYFGSKKLPCIFKVCLTPVAPETRQLAKRQNTSAVLTASKTQS